MLRPTTLLGLDFSCAPSKRKPLTLAWGRRAGQVIRLDRVDELTTLAALETLIAPAATELADGFVMGCDLPFGLPSPFVAALREHGPGDLPGLLHDLPSTATDMPANTAFAADRLIQSLHQHCGNRAGFQHLIDNWGQTWQAERPAGSKLLHRVTDRAVPGLSSTSPLQTRYVPVGKMYFEGMARLVQANLTLPGLRQGRHDAIAFEAYPGLLAGELLGKRSYKSETDATQERLIARMDLVDALEQGRTRLGLRLKLSPAQRDQLVADPKGDRLDAVLCLMQAGWAHWQHEQGSPTWGLPAQIDPVEGWILTA
ncbi:MAG: DUF429 domain-containing protein [Aquabacterium sp.]|uniref:DUF429 domain-containing protein n=1 Tax=Aquabacterium sp. TaxID=1872578 RepID=UPI0011F5C6F4|nr:DUF429 domain-containing protein [Aquabacterium sp.]TAK93972.1 MAG: DUF429 domain-containing protein [Aquabacterium sp.]